MGKVNSLFHIVVNVHMDILTWRDMLHTDEPIPVLISIGPGMQMTGMMFIMLMRHVNHVTRRATPIG
jgi:hypothetical protein